MRNGLRRKEKRIDLQESPLMRDRIQVKNVIQWEAVDLSSMGT